MNKKEEFPFIGIHVCGFNLEDIANDLIRMKNDKINYYYDFLGHRLYSDTVTVEKAYHEVYGMSREDYRKEVKKDYKKYLENIKKNIELETSKKKITNIINKPKEKKQIIMKDYSYPMPFKIPDFNIKPLTEEEEIDNYERKCTTLEVYCYNSRQSNEIDYIKNNKLNIKQILRAIYLLMYQNGYEEISLKQEDIKEQAEKLEIVFNEYQIDTEDLFIKTPVSETYDNYANYLINIFLQRHLGYMNEKYDKIILNCEKTYVDKELDNTDNYDQLLETCYKELIGKYPIRKKSIR